MKLQATLVGITPYSSNKADQLEKMDGEDDVAVENRRKVERVHKNKKGEVCIPAITFVNMLASTAKRVGMPVPGSKKERYTKSFVSGVIPPMADPVLRRLSDGTAFKAEEIGKTDDSRFEAVYCHSDGKREGGSGKRVTRFYPYFEGWVIDIELEVIDPKLTPDIVLQHLVCAGMYNGLGRFRPQNRGTLGRFRVFQGKKEIAKTIEVSAPEED